MRGSTLVLGVLLPICAIAPDARAQTAQRGPALNWVRLPGAESCIAPVELAERVEQRLGRAVFVRMPDAIVVVEGQVAPNAAPGAGFAAVVRVTDMQGVAYGARELALADPDCRKLDDLLALVIAVTIRGRSASSGIALPAAIQSELDALFGDEPAEFDPAQLPSRPSAQAPASAPAEAPPRPDRASAATPPHDPPADPSPQLGLGGGLSAVTGLQPDGTVGPAAHLRFGLPQLGSAALSFTVGLSQEQAAPDPLVEDGSFSLQPLLVALALCGPDVIALASAVSLCAQVAVGRLRSESEGFMYDHTTAASWVELGAEASARVPVIAPLYLRFLMRMPVRLSRPAFVYRTLAGDPVEAFQVAQVGFGGELALGIDLL